MMARSPLVILILFGLLAFSGAANASHGKMLRVRQGSNSQTCSQKAICRKVTGAAAKTLDPNSPIGRAVAQSNMSPQDYATKICGIKPPEPPKQETPPPPPAPAPAPSLPPEQPPPKQPPAPQPAPQQPPQNNNGGGDGGDEQQYLDIHNSLRAKHGAGPLSWDDGLAAEAQNWANGCKFQHSGAGENLAAGTGDYTIDSALGSWAGEEPQYNAATQSGAGHYTQMIWKGTTKVGCALAPSCAGIFSDPAKYYVCEYDPPGNVSGEFGANVS